MNDSETLDSPDDEILAKDQCHVQGAPRSADILVRQRAQRAHPSPFTKDRNAAKFFKSARGSS